MKEFTSPVLFSDVLVKVLKVDECKLDSNINNGYEVDDVVVIGPIILLSRMENS